MKALAKLLARALSGPQIRLQPLRHRTAPPNVLKSTQLFEPSCPEIRSVYTLTQLSLPEFFKTVLTDTRLTQFLQWNLLKNSPGKVLFVAPARTLAMFPSIDTVIVLATDGAFSSGHVYTYLPFRPVKEAKYRSTCRLVVSRTMFLP